MNVPTNLLSVVFRQGRRFQHRKGDIILRGNNGSHDVYWIESGYVKAYTLTEEGEENVLFIFKAGEIFPLTQLILDSARIIFYEAMTGTTTWRISADTFKMELRADPELLYEAFQHTVTQLGHTLDRIDNLEYTSAYERVVYRILYLAKRFGVKCESGIVIELAITQQDIADSVNLARETASRVIERLERDNLINYQAHRLLITNVKKLQREISVSSEDAWEMV